MPNSPRSAQARIPPMNEPDELKQTSPRELTQLLRLQEAILESLTHVRNQLLSPKAEEILGNPEAVVGEAAADMRRVLDSVEKAIRDLKLSEAELRKDLLEGPDDGEPVDGLPLLPPRLSRFLAQRAKTPNFEYDVRQDSVRGWIVRWTEFTETGSIRGSGQFYERPYAWLDD